MARSATGVLCALSHCCKGLVHAGDKVVGHGGGRVRGGQATEVIDGARGLQEGDSPPRLSKEGHKLAVSLRKGGAGCLPGASEGTTSCPWDTPVTWQF